MCSRGHSMLMGATQSAAVPKGLLTFGADLCPQSREGVIWMQGKF